MSRPPAGACTMVALGDSPGSRAGKQAVSLVPVALFLKGDIELFLSIALTCCPVLAYTFWLSEALLAPVQHQL